MANIMNHRVQQQMARLILRGFKRMRLLLLYGGDVLFVAVVGDYYCIL